MTAKTDMIYCPICLEIFVTPRALPCLHTFCELCLHEYIRGAAGSNRRSTFTGFDCPTCRRHVPAPSKDSWEKWAEHFVLNHMMVTLIDENKGKDPGLQKQIDEKIKSLSLQPKKVEVTPTVEEPLKSSVDEVQPNTEPEVPDQAQSAEYNPPAAHFPPFPGPPGWRHFRGHRPPHGPPPHHWPPPHGPPPHGPPPHGPPPHGPPPPWGPHHRHHHRPHSGRGHHRGHCHRHRP